MKGEGEIERDKRQREKGGKLRPISIGVIVRKEYIVVCQVDSICQSIHAKKR